MCWCQVRGIWVSTETIAMSLIDAFLRQWTGFSILFVASATLNKVYLILLQVRACYQFDHCPFFSAVADLLSTWPKSTKLDNYLVIISKFLLWKYIWEYCSQNHCKSVQSPNDVKQDLFCKSACPRLPPRYISMMLSLVFMRFGGNAKPFVVYSLKLTFWLE